MVVTPEYIQFNQARGSATKKFELESTGFAYIELEDETGQSALGFTLSTEELTSLRDFINTIL